MRRVTSALAASAIAALVAAWPSVVLAQDRSLATPDDMFLVVGVTILALLAVLVGAGVGYLYRRETNLDWDFQRPDEPYEDDH